MYPILFLLLLPLGCLWAQAGCTDSLARNYNAAATTNDGSCIFDTLSLSPDASFLLDSALDETSGLAYWQGQLWTHNDDTDTALYALDTLDGSILGIYPLPGVRNFDWEELSQDSLYFYLGDFGNNRGNRLDLHILRIEKQSLLSGNPQIDSIAFAYEDQTDFTIALNDNNYDCEALVLSRDSIYLFTKRWVDLRSFVYRLPKEPGSYQAELLDSFDAQGLITGAYYDEDLRLLALCGYSPFLQPFVYSCYDFGGKYFFFGQCTALSARAQFSPNRGHYKCRRPELLPHK